jgi:hypothetical protein
LGAIRADAAVHAHSRPRPDQTPLNTTPGRDVSQGKALEGAAGVGLSVVSGRAAVSGFPRKKSMCRLLPGIERYVKMEGRTMEALYRAALTGYGQRENPHKNRRGRDSYPVRAAFSINKADILQNCRNHCKEYTTKKNRLTRSTLLCMAGALMALTLGAACGGGGTENPAKINLDGIWYWNEYEQYDDDVFFDGNYSLTIAGNSYTRTADVIKSQGPWYGYFEKGTFKRTKTDWTFLPEIRGNYEEDAQPLSVEERKSMQSTVPFSISGDTLRIGDQEYRRAFTGTGEEYAGSMVRGKTRQDIVLTIGGFQDGEIINSFYVYTRRNTPIKLEGILRGTVMRLEEEDGFFTFFQFDPEADAVTGTWGQWLPEQPYEVTLTKKKE